MNIQNILNKNSVFTALIALTVIIILVRITPVSVDPVVKVVISKNRVGISNIYQQLTSYLMDKQ